MFISRSFYLLVDFLDHYIDLLSYLKKRQERAQEFKKNLARQHVRYVFSIILSSISSTVGYS